MAFFRKSGGGYGFSCIYRDDGDGRYSGVFRMLDAGNARRLAVVWRITAIIGAVIGVGMLLALAASMAGAQVPVEWMYAVFVADSILLLPVALLAAISKKERVSKQRMELEVRRSATVYASVILVLFNYCAALSVARIMSPVLAIFIVLSIAAIVGSAWRLRQLQALSARG